MARKLTQDEIARAKEEHIRILNEIDRQEQARKDTNATFKAMIKDLRMNESEIRFILQTGQAVPEQLSLIPNGESNISELNDNRQ